MGGTFMSMPGDYRDYFIRNLHDALSGHSSSSVHEAVRYSEQVRCKHKSRVKSVAGCLGGSAVQTAASAVAPCKHHHLKHMLLAVPHQVHRADH